MCYVLKFVIFEKQLRSEVHGYNQYYVRAIITSSRFLLIKRIYYIKPISSSFGAYVVFSVGVVVTYKVHTLVKMIIIYFIFCAPNT